MRKNDAVYPNQTLTWSVWFKPEKTSGTIFWDDDSVNGNDRFISLEGGSLVSGDWGRLMSTNIVSLNQWHHAVFTSSTNGQYLYLDGTFLVSSNAIILNHANRSSISFGAGNCTCGGPNNVFKPRFKGAISKVRIYNRTLSAGEVQQMYLDEAALDFSIKPAVELMWSTINNQVYQVQSSFDLTNWNNIGSSILGIGGFTNQFYSVDSSNKFFRLKLQ
ncbi:MAG: LamG domain-containing protein [Verrucomicrobiota bacterium]|nr:LamG domain-containing protein [Verrucomicrobiota bacterium]